MLKKVIVLLVLLGCSFVLMMLTTGESHFEVQSHASYPAAPERVWQLLADVEHWPDWWPGLESARLVGAFSAGGEIELRLKKVSSMGPALLTLVSPPHELAWEGEGVLGSRAGTRFFLEGDAAGSRVRIENFVRGPQAFLARFTGEAAFVAYQQAHLKSLGLALAEKRIETARLVD